MNKYHIDWRRPSVRHILEALSHGLAANAQRFHAGGDVDDALDFQNDLCGIAFVTTQAYITCVVADVNSLRRTRPPIHKHEILRLNNPVVAHTTLTRMQLCNSMANYYKHRDEWKSWKHECARKTTLLLEAAGFTENDTHLCTTAASLLLGNIKVESFVPLIEMVGEWRIALIACETA